MQQGQNQETERRRVAGADRSDPGAGCRRTSAVTIASVGGGIAQPSEVGGLGSEIRWGRLALGLCLAAGGAVQGAKSKVQEWTERDRRCIADAVRCRDNAELPSMDPTWRRWWREQMRLHAMLATMDRVKALREERRAA